MKNLHLMLEGWTNLTLERKDGVWCICTRVAFVPLEKAAAELVAACPGAREKLIELDSEPF